MNLKPYLLAGCSAAALFIFSLPLNSAFAADVPQALPAASTTNTASQPTANKANKSDKATPLPLPPASLLALPTDKKAPKGQASSAKAALPLPLPPSALPEEKKSSPDKLPGPQEKNAPAPKAPQLPVKPALPVTSEKSGTAPVAEPMPAVSLPGKTGDIAGNVDRELLAESGGAVAILESVGPPPETGNQPRPAEYYPGAPAEPARATAPPVLLSSGVQSSGNVPVIAAAPVLLPAGVKGEAVEIPVGAEVGAAAFSDRNFGFVVFSTRRSVNLSGIPQNYFIAGAATALLPNATVLSFPLPRGYEIRLAPDSNGWIISITLSPPSQRAIPFGVQDGKMWFSLHDLGSVVTVPDPLNGLQVLVATQTVPGYGIAVRHNYPLFSLLSSTQGIAILSRSDGLSLNTAALGVTLSTVPGLTGGLGLADTPPQLNQAASLPNAHFTRSFDFPNLPLAELRARINQALYQAAMATPQNKARYRIRLAEDLIAAGMGAEAKGVLGLTAAQFPFLTEAPRFQALQGIADWLSGDLKGASVLDNNNMPTTDEALLWRAAYNASEAPGSIIAAAQFAVTAPLIYAYPYPLQVRLGPLAVETMIAGNRLGAAKEFLTYAPHLPSYDLARGMLDEKEGNNGAAENIYQKLSRNQNRLISTKATLLLTGLRLETGKITKDQAINEYKNLLIEWQTVNFDLPVRLQIAGLQFSQDHWLKGFQTLNKAAFLFPQQADYIGLQIIARLNQLIDPKNLNRIPSSEFVEIASDNRQLLSGLAEDSPLPQKIATLLQSLPLSPAAIPLLQTLIKVPSVRTELKDKLALKLVALNVDAGNSAEALSLLGQINKQDLPDPASQAQYTLLRAAALSENGNQIEALQVLYGQESEAADMLRAQIAQKASLWGIVVASLQKVVAGFPQSGPLDPVQQSILVRLAGAAFRMKDTNLLKSLNAQYSDRFNESISGNLFKLLTGEQQESGLTSASVDQNIHLAENVLSDLSRIG